MRKHTISMVVLVLVSSLLGGSAGWASDALTPVGSTAMPFNIVSGTFAVWTGGVFVFVQDRFSATPTLRFFDRNGNQMSQFTFSIPEAILINLYDHSVALGLDGSLAIVGTAYTNDSMGGMFVAWVSADRQEQVIVRTSPFFPRAVTMASDGTIWVAGYEPKPHRDYDYSQCLIRRYDRAGKLIGSFVPWSTLGTSPRPVPVVHSLLLPLKDHVGWYSPDSNTYVEFSLDGSVVKRFKSAPHPQHDLVQVAACENGNLFASTRIIRGERQTNWGIFTLDRERGTWSLIPRNERWGMLLGCDGTRLATATDFKAVSWLETTQ